MIRQAVIGQNCGAQTAREYSVPFLASILCHCVEIKSYIEPFKIRWLLRSVAVTGTHKGSKMKNALTSPVRKNTSLSTSASKKPTSIAQRSKSKHFSPASPVAGEVKFIKAREEWEDQFLIALHKKGKNNTQISQHLPGRSEGACRTRRCRLKLRARMLVHNEKDALASPAPKKSYLFKEWEDREDQIIVTHHNAGATFGNISKIVSSRTRHMVRSRRKKFLEHQPQNIVALQTQAPGTRQVEFWTLWKEEEDELLKALRASGKGWAEIATQLPTR